MGTKTKTLTRTEEYLLKHVIYLLFFKYTSHFYTKRNLKSKGCPNRAYLVDYETFKKYKVFPKIFSTTFIGF